MDNIIITRLDVCSEGNETVISIPLSEVAGFIKILPVSLRALMVDSRVSAVAASINMRFACTIGEYYSKFDNFIPLMREKNPDLANKLTDSCSTAEYMSLLTA